MGSMPANAVLYHHPLSVCSIMVRYSYALRGQPKDPENQLVIRDEAVKIFEGEQMTEHYLCDVNANGEVPVLAPKFTERTVPESLDITYYLADLYPSLLPASHKEDICELLKELHEISFFALTFAGRPQVQATSIAKLEKMRDEPNTSERHRKAIDFKIERIKKSKMAVLNDECLESSKEKTRRYLGKIDELLNESSTRWCFSLTEPSALDAHTVVFLARLNDIPRKELIPERVQAYAEKAFAEPVWKDEVMHGITSTRPW